MASLLQMRSTARELLDAEHLDEHELRTNLREMAMLNRIPNVIVDHFPVFGMDQRQQPFVRH